MTTAILKYGDTVKIKPGTRYYRTNDDHNPQDTIGHITARWEQWVYSYTVRWPSLRFSVYDSADLIPANEPIILEAVLAQEQ